MYQRTRTFSYTTTPHKGLQPESSDPPPPKTEPHLSSNTEPTPISEETYHEKADSYLDRLVLALEEKAESNSDYEVEYDVGPPISCPRKLCQHPPHPYEHA